MSDFVLTCCSTADRKKSFFEERGIKYVCFHYTMDDVEYTDDLGESMSFEEFYKKIQDGSMSRTSQVNCKEYLEFFEPILKEGKDIIHVSLSSALSGEYNSANIARDELMEKYPDRKITIIDSLAACAGYGLLVEYLDDMKKAGKSYEEICAWAEDNKRKIHHWVLTSDLTSFKRGGRINGAEAFIGGLLNICPILTIDRDGRLVVDRKIRTKKKAMVELVNIMRESIDNGQDFDDKCLISHSACLEDALNLQKEIEEEFPKLKGKIEINDIGTAIGSHTGPGTTVLFFKGKEK